MQIISTEFLLTQTIKHFEFSFELRVVKDLKDYFK